MAAAASLAIAHPDILARVLPALFSRLQSTLPSAFSPSSPPSSIDELGLLLSAFSHIIAHCTQQHMEQEHSRPLPRSPLASPALPSVSQPALPSTLLLDVAQYVCGLLYSCAVQGGAASDGVWALDERLMGSLLTSTHSLAAALSSEQQRRLFASLLPALTTGDAQALLADYQRTAQQLLIDRDTQTPAEPAPLHPPPSPSRLPSPTLSPPLLSGAPLPLLRRFSSPPLRQLLSAFASILSSARPDVAEWIVQQPSRPTLVDRIIEYVRAEASTAAFDSAPTQPSLGYGAVLYCCASLLNKLPARHEQLHSIIDRAVIPAVVEVEEGRGADEEQQPLTDERLSLICLSLKALSMRTHPLSGVLLSRYLHLPSSPSSALRHFPSSLWAWASGFALLVGDLPFHLTRLSHCVQGVGLLYKQRILALALPTLLEEVARGRERARKRIEGGGRAAEGEEVEQWTERTGPLLAAVQLLSSVPFSLLPSASIAGLVSLFHLAMASPLALCRRLALQTLHQHLMQGMDAQLLVDHCTTLIPFLLARIEGQPSAKAEEMSALATNGSVGGGGGEDGGARGADVAADEAEVVRAVSVLSALCASLPYSVLYPHRVAVLRALSAAVDHRSRRVRRAAIEVRAKVVSKA